MRANLRTNWLICYYRRLRFFAQTFLNAGVAQLVEQLICNHQVGGSSPFTGSVQYDVYGLGRDKATYRFLFSSHFP